MSLDLVAVSYTGVLVGMFAAMLVVALCAAGHYVLARLEPFLWEAVEPSLLRGYR